jgi:hypothetical protein
MKKRVSTLTGLVVVLALAFAGTASAATTLGTTTQPTGSDANGCGEDGVINQLTSDPGTPYGVPGTGTITQWQINTTGDTPGTPVTFVVLRGAGFAGYTAVGVDTRNIPTPLPVGGVATYALASPIAVQAGDTFGLYTGSNIDVICYWDDGDTPAGDSLAELETATAPTLGQPLPIGDVSGGGYTMNLAATFEPPAAAGPTPPRAPAPAKKKCKKHKKKRSAASAKKKCKKKKKR